MKREQSSQVVCGETTQPEVGTMEYCQAKLDEWNRQAESAEKERADLLDRLAKAEQRLKEAVWVIINSNPASKLTTITLTTYWKRRNAFLASQKDAK